MQHEHFSRHLREKYPTRVHLAERLNDLHQQRLSTRPVEPLLKRNLLRAQREISLPLIAYLNQPSEPYLNECLRAAERVNNSRHSERDRRICYENFLLAEKLQAIKKPLRRSARLKDTASRVITRSSSHEDDQATAADVDTSIESDTSISPESRTYQHLSSIDMTMIRDASERMKSSPRRHFSICVLRPPDSTAQRKCAFKKEILHH